MTIVEFLEARLAEDEAIARAIDNKQADSGWDFGYNQFGLAKTPPGWYVTPHIGLAYEAESAAHIARNDPARVLREVAAKRAIIADMNHAEDVAEAEREVDREYWSWESKAEALTDALRRLASVYADHPDYNESWAL